MLSEGSESRDNHRYAVVVQDLATQWLQSYLCKPKSSQGTQKNLMKFLEPTRKPKVIYTDNALEFGKALESLHVNTTQIRNPYVEWRDICGAIALQSSLGNEWCADSMERRCYLRNIQDLLSDRKTPCERRIGMPLTDQ